MKHQIMAIAAGLLFGIWPLFMNKSNLSGFVTCVVVSCIQLTLLITPALMDTSSLYRANWTMTIIAAVIATGGVVIFNTLLSEAMPAKVGILFVVMLVAQTCPPAIYSIIVNRGITWMQAVGFSAAIVAAIFLCYPSSSPQQNQTKANPLSDNAPKDQVP
ncbi:MAG: hypothetical protein V4519_02050 [Patescibacteria group bacterium]